MFSLKYESKKIKLLLLIISVTFLIINLFTIIKFGNKFLLGSMDKMNNDDVKYIRSALTLINEGRFTYQNPNVSSVFIMPGIVLTIAPFLKFLSLYDALTAFRIFQAVLQVLSLFLIFFISRKIFNSKIGVIACIIDALYVPEITSTCKILTEVEFKFFLLLLVYISIYAIESKKAGYYAAGGLIWGIACLYRPTILLFPIAILIMWLIKRYSFKEMFKFAIITATVFIVVLSPWWIRNYSTFKEFIPLTQSTGNPFLHGTYLNYQGFKATTLGDKKEFALGVKRLKENFKKQPIRYLGWYTLGKSRYFWSWPYTSKVFKKNINKYFCIYHDIILFLALTGLLIVILRKQKLNIFLIAVILYFNMIHLPYLTASRYAYPVMPLVIMLSACTVWEVITQSMSLRRKIQTNARDL